MLSYRMVHIKYPLLLIERVSHVVAAVGFLSEWFFTMSDTIYRGTDFPFQIFPFSVFEFNKFLFFSFYILCSTLSLPLSPPLSLPLSPSLSFSHRWLQIKYMCCKTKHAILFLFVFTFFVCMYTTKFLLTTEIK